MSYLLQPARPLADRLSRLIEPVVVALGTTGMAGAALVGLALLAGHGLQQLGLAQR